MHRKIASTFVLAIAMLGLFGCSRTVDDVAKWESTQNVEKLTGALSDPKAEVREAAITSLGTLKADGAIDDIAACFNDTEESVVVASVNALAAMENKSATTALIAALKLDNLTARIAAAEALGALKAPGAVEPLAELLHDPSAEIQLAAIAAIGRIGDEKGSQPLVDKLAVSSAASIRKACIDALGSTRGNTALKALVDSLADEDEQISKAATTSLIKLGDPAIPSIIDGLRSEHEGVRAASVSLLRGLSAIPTRGHAQVWYQIARATTDENPEIDADIVKILAGLGEEAITPLLEASAHGDPEIRDYAITALETIGEPCAAKATALVLSRAKPEAKAWFEGRTAWAGAPSWRLDLWGAAAAFNPEFDFNDSKVSKLKAGGAGAATLLSRSDFEATRAYIPLLIHLLGDDACAKAASEKLAEAGYNASFPLITALADTNNAIADGAAAILAPRKDARAYQPLIDTLKRRIDAGETLSKSPAYSALVLLNNLEADAIILRVRPSTERAIQVFERQYHDARVIGAQTSDPYTDNEAPVLFHLAFEENGKPGKLDVTFKKDSKGDWRPSPAMPYKLPLPK